MTLPNPILGPKTSRVATHGKGTKSGGALSKIAHFVPENSVFEHKTSPKPIQNGEAKVNECYTSHTTSPPCNKQPFATL